MQLSLTHTSRHADTARTVLELSWLQLPVDLCAYGSGEHAQGKERARALPLTHARRRRKKNNRRTRNARTRPQAQLSQARRRRRRGSRCRAATPARRIPGPAGRQADSSAEIRLRLEASCASYCHEVPEAVAPVTVHRYCKAACLP